MRQRVLDVSEGLPEYTAWVLTGGPAADLARTVRTAAAGAGSYVRSFPYSTGPAYAVLADLEIGHSWRREIVRQPDLQQIVAAAIRDVPPSVSAMLRGDSSMAAALRKIAELSGRSYGLDSIRVAERTRWSERQRQIAALRARFVDGPVIRFRPGVMQVSFDPGRQTSLGADGTVVGGLGWRGANGAELSAPSGALVTPNFSEIRLPRDSVAMQPGPIVEQTTWRGVGWTLTLPAGWRIDADSIGLVVRPPPR